MHVVVIIVFRAWLKSSLNMKIILDSTIKRLTCEGITTFKSLEDFDRKAIQSLPSIYKEEIPAITTDIAAGITAENEVPGAIISPISG